MNDNIKQSIEKVCQSEFGIDTAVIFERPDKQFGDIAINIAMQLAGVLKQKPRDVAERLLPLLQDALADVAAEVTIAGPGFINIRLNDRALWGATERTITEHFKGETVVAEYSDPNPFKILHAGHVYTTVVGDAIATLLEEGGATVHRVNFGGDVGLHVAKTLYIVLRRLGGENADGLTAIEETGRAEWLAAAYSEGHAAYVEDAQAKVAITQLNRRIYDIQQSQDHDSALARIYWTCREWSYAAFDAFYKRLGTTIEKYYPESATVEPGMDAVKTHIGTVFEESEGAVIFRGEKFGLHNRVFINQQGLPTYETKDVGLILKKYEDYHFDRSVVVTGNEQEQYMHVVLKAIEQFLPDLARSTTYVPHGMLRLAGGVKMSSRLGNIVRASVVLDSTTEALAVAGRKEDPAIMLAAIKYAFLKSRLGRDLIYDPKESIALEGNSGPAILYAHARARSILSKVDSDAVLTEALKYSLQPDERALLRKISEYQSAVEKAQTELMPHHICTYLYELAQEFNRFYEHNRVVDDLREVVRAELVKRYAATLKQGLRLLNITAPDQM
ncbi:MAG TPA: arginine--tRNA ligase [Candidatus Saccharimonadales bacterium]